MDNKESDSPDRCVTSCRRSRIQFLFRPKFATSWVAGWCVLTTSIIRIIDFVEPIPLLDRAFYFRLYLAIGLAAGLLSWFAATLVARSKLQFGTLFLLLLPLAFVILVSLDRNPLVAGLTVFIAVTTTALAYAAVGSHSACTDLENGVNEEPDSCE